MLKNIERKLNLVKGGIAFLKLVQNPKELDKVIEISQRLAEPELLMKMAEKAMQSSPEVQTALQTRARIDLQYLYKIEATLNENDLGACYLKFMRDRNLDPADLPTFPSDTPASYVQAHLIETHDLWHVICGFETNEAGELGLQAFYLAQLGAPLSGVLIGGGFLNAAIKEPQDTDARMEEIIRGWHMGKSAKQLFGTDWNQYWNKPVNEVRQHFKISEAKSVFVS